ncbi:MAG: FlgD immunoglobulin-like domain containing protein [Melioribacteraceae bacterium]|nr:T9SS type A sorting domain-containing protein [Melioribacteraceae bacterium]WKZ69627.1 MAG: FlgD immunoglobulin-like domain containing protein [Melioribacteraceae bacterium]WKZ69638.1 MAG: FlgD immunoglobulin-like domain containing protein [Melioribacteraceae bacterium]
MKQKLQLLITSCFFLLFSIQLFSQNSLYIIKPDWGWWVEQGTIEEATLTIKPKGVFFEYGLYLTFAVTTPNYYNENDSLEAELIFTLGDDAIVHDSWLWIEDEIIQAEIMDEWTAGSIYNEIVGRNLDPSILFKREGYYGNSDYYELRVFPLLKDLPRKVKITYLVPTDWTASRVMASLPTELLTTSAKEVDKLRLVVYPTEQWTSPEIVENPELTFENGSDTTFGDYQFVEIPTSYLYNNLTFSLKSPMQEGIYLSTFTEENEDYYQLALLPSEILSSETSKKVMVLFDYKLTNSTITKSEILNGTKNSLLNYLSDADSFNIAFSRLTIDRTSDVWLPADSVTIAQTFENITEDNLANYGNLPSLINDGVEFINSQGGDGVVLLIANTDDVMDPESANELIDDIFETIEGDLTFHVADFQNRNVKYVYIGNQYYEGNQYFYNNISRMTGGNLTRMLDGYSFNELLTKAFQGVGGFISTFDLYTSLTNGFCYGRYNINLTGSSTYLDMPIFQLGKFNGSGDFTVEINGVYEGNVFTRNFEITDDIADQSDSTLRKMWVSRYIKELEGQGSANNIISEIIGTSISNRVLSYHTAFICLEPSLGGEVCYDCRDDGGGSTDVETDSVNVIEEFSLAAYPNPFNSQTKIRVNLPPGMLSDNISFKIYNILGQVVKTFELNPNTKGTYEFNWDGRNDYGETVSSGIYIFVAITPQKTHSVKLQMIK